jgi:hypothetical protein
MTEMAIPRDLVLTVIGFVIAFALAALVIRLQREIEMRDKGERNWLTCADELVVVATALAGIAFIAVFALPSQPYIASIILMLLIGATILEVGYIPSILAHYRIVFGTNQVGLRQRCEPLERCFVRWAFAVALGMSGLAWCWFQCRVPMIS